MKFRLELQEYGHAAPDGHCNRHIADHDVGADGEHQQHGYVGGDAAMRVRRIVGKRGLVQFVQSTGHRLKVGRAILANWTCPLFPAGLNQMADNRDRHHPQHSGGDDPGVAHLGGQHGRDGAEDGNQREGSHSSEPTGGMLPLQSDQQAQQQRNSQLLKHRFHDKKCSTRSGGVFRGFDREFDGDNVGASV